MQYAHSSFDVFADVLSFTQKKKVFIQTHYLTWEGIIVLYALHTVENAFLFLLWT